jgi:hypothetical protein
MHGMHRLYLNKPEQLALFDAMHIPNPSSSSSSSSTPQGQRQPLDCTINGVPQQRPLVLAPQRLLRRRARACAQPARPSWT